MVSFPYYSHIFRDSYGNSMGPAYHKQVPCPWGSLESPLRIPSPKQNLRIQTPYTPYIVGIHPIYPLTKWDDPPSISPLSGLLFVFFFGPKNPITPSKIDGLNIPSGLDMGFFARSLGLIQTDPNGFGGPKKQLYMG